MRCKTCHYSLANLKEHRCPECGTPFDPNDRSTFDLDEVRSSALTEICAVGFLSALIAAVLYLYYALLVPYFLLWAFVFIPTLVVCKAIQFGTKVIRSNRAGW